MRFLARAAQRLPFWAYMPGRVKALVEALGNPAHYPVSMQIEPTRRCNLKCVMCASVHCGRDPRPDLSLDAFRKILDQVPSLKEVTLTGLGESFMNPHMIDFIELARSRDIYTRFITNLTYLTDEKIERLVAAGHSELIVSMETSDPDTFADIRRGASLNTVLGNMRKIAEAKKRLNVTVPTMHVHAILMKCVLPHIPGLVRTLKELGVASLTFVDFNTNGVNLETRLRDGSTLRDNLLSSFMTEDEIWEFLRGVAQLGDESFRVVLPGEYGGLKQTESRGVGVLTCEHLWGIPYITCDGTVTPCCWAPHPGIFSMGSLERNSFDEIWFGTAFLRLRLAHLLNRHPAYCRNCQQLVYTVGEPSRRRGTFDIKKRFTRSFLFR